MIKIGSFFEEHIEKIVLVIFGLLCVWLMITRVLLSPNQVVYEKTKYSPSAIDERVYEDAELLRQKQLEPADQLESYKPKAVEFLAMLDSAVSDIDINLWPPRPYNVASRTDVNRSYRLPVIGEVNEVAIEHIRAVAYCPTTRITEQNLYYTAGREPNDIDLVTVEAKFDVRGLYERFRESFVDNVEEQWADPCLAKPVFAAVQLQRKELNEDGTWSDWQNVPRSKIDHNRNLFEISEDVEGLPPGGLKVQILQLENRQVQIELLQPQSYQFATASEEWFPPLLHRKYADIQRKEALELRRIARDEERLERDSNTDSDRRRSRRTDRTGLGGMLGGGDTLGGAGGAYGAGGETRRRSRSSDRTTSSSSRGGLATGSGDTRRRSRSSDRLTSSNTRGGLPTDGRRPTDGGRRTRGRDGSPDTYDGSGDYSYGRGGQVGSELMEIYEEYSELMLTSETDFARMREDVVFWTHDDTVEPQKSYQYRVRLGVFNPVAGTNQASERDASRSDKVILWSEFSETTETVEIPGTLYFFAREIQEAAKTVTITVCHYVLGRWHKEDFIVGQGEVIGDVVETEPEEPEETESARRRSGRLTAATTVRSSVEATVPEIIDYGTGAVMVDTMAVSDWTGDKNMRTRHYYDMLYSYDGTNIEHAPVGTVYWKDDLRSAYSSILRLQREPQEPFKAWSGGGRGRGGRGMDDFGGRGMMGGMGDGYGG